MSHIGFCVFNFPNHEIHEKKFSSPIAVMEWIICFIGVWYEVFLLLSSEEPIYRCGSSQRLIRTIVIIMSETLYSEQIWIQSNRGHRMYYISLDIEVAV